MCPLDSELLPADGGTQMHLVATSNSSRGAVTPLTETQTHKNIRNLSTAVTEIQSLPSPEARRCWLLGAHQILTGT